MRWFKHYTDSLDDPFVQELLDKYSHLGYTVWFGLIEIICKETGKDLTKKFECSPTYLRRKLRTSQTKLREVLDFCQTGGRLLITFSQEKWEFQIPKIAEIKDNHTSNLQVTCKPLDPKNKSKNKEKEKEKKVKNIYGEYKNIRLAKNEYERLKKDFTLKQLLGMIKVLDEYKEISGKAYKNDNLVLRGWVLKKWKEERPSSGGSTGVVL